MLRLAGILLLASAMTPAAAQAATPAAAASPHVLCLSEQTSAADRKSAGDAARAMIEGQNGADTRLRGAVKKLVDACTARERWSPQISAAASNHLWFMLLEGTLGLGLDSAGLDRDALLAFAERLPEADRKPFFSSAEPMSAAFRARISNLIGQARLKGDSPALRPVMIDYLYTAGNMRATGEHLTRISGKPGGPVPVAGGAAPPAEDPRACLIARVPADHEKLVQSIRRQVFPGEVTGTTIPEDPYRKAAAERCVDSEGWPVAYTATAADLLFGEVRAQLIGPRLKQQGYDLARLDSYLTSQTAERLHRLKWLSERNQDFSRDWSLLTGLVGQQPRDPAQKELLLQYVRNRSEADRALKIFAAVQQINTGSYISQGWQVLPALEASRPVIRERVLSKEEKAEVARLARSYAAGYQQGGRTLPELQRLMDLGQSGDKAAMIAARDALARGVPFDLSSHYSDLNIDTTPFRMFTERLTAIWTAMIWHRFGYDDASRRYMKPCVGGLYGEVYKHEKDGVAAMLASDGTVRPVNSQGIQMDQSADGCGFTLLGVPAAQARGATVLQFYDKRGSFGALGNRAPARDFAITGVRFSPMMGDARFLQSKFEEHLTMRRAGLMYDARSGLRTFATPTLLVTMPWYNHYARETGQLAKLDQADAQSNEAIAARLRAEARSRVAAWERALERHKEEPLNQTRRDQLMYAASALGGAYWQEYKRLVPDPQPVITDAPRMVGSGAGSSGYREVEVRSYDRNGTYTGSTRMSAAWADIMKMTSGPPR